MRRVVSVKNLVNSLMSLPFVPPDDVEMVFDLLYDSITSTTGQYAQQVIKLWDYVDRVYLRGEDNDERSCHHVTLGGYGTSILQF